MLTIDPQNTSMHQMHQYLLGAVGPRPICFASTVDKDGNRNLAPFSFFNVFSSSPPIAIFSPNRSGRTGEQKHTYENIKEVPEVVINVVTYDMVHQVSLASSPYPKGVDEFVKAGFTPVDSETIRPARVKESPVQMECVVLDVKELGDKGGAGNLIICEIKRMHIAEHILDDGGKIDQQRIDLVARMGGHWYCRAHGDALFELDKPLTTTGIGFDNLPEHVRNSEVLTGNHLGQLANVEALPTENEVQEYNDLVKPLLSQRETLAIQLLNKKQVKEAWCILLG